VVTGASGGIGAAITRALCSRGYKVFAVARRAERLEALASATGCIPIVADLGDADHIYAKFENFEADVLVNNAGIGRGFDGMFAASRADIEEIIAVNLAATVHMTRLIAPGMIARGRGHIVNISSIGGYYTTRFALYGATKGAMHQFNRNLRLELAGTGVRTTDISPGRTRSDFFEDALADEKARHAATESFETLVPDDIAAAAMFAIEAPWRANITIVEVAATEQLNGGQYIVRADRDGGR